MGKAAKSKSRQSRRADSDGVGNLSPVGGSVDNNATNTTPGIVVKLGSIDSKKRLGALVMLNDLLIQNSARSMALGKLTEPETLSALSVRLLDTSIEVVQQTIICLITISRMGKLYVEKLSLIGLDVTIVRLLSQSLSTIDIIQTGEAGSNVQRSIPFLLLELVKVMFTNAPSFAKSKRDSIATMILQNSSKLVSHINVAEFVCELLSITTVDSAVLCRQLYDGQLHGTVKAALVLSPNHTTAEEAANNEITTAALCLDTLLSAILLNLLSCSDSEINETNASSLLVLLPRLIERVSLRLPSLPPTIASASIVASTAMRVDDAATAARGIRTLDDNKVRDNVSHKSFYERSLILSPSSYLTIYEIV